MGPEKYKTNEQSLMGIQAHEINWTECLPACTSYQLSAPYRCPKEPPACFFTLFYLFR